MRHGPCWTATLKSIGGLKPISNRSPLRFRKLLATLLILLAGGRVERESEVTVLRFYEVYRCFLKEVVASTGNILVRIFLYVHLAARLQHIPELRCIIAVEVLIPGCWSKSQVSKVDIDRAIVEILADSIRIVLKKVGPARLPQPNFCFYY